MHVNAWKNLCTFGMLKLYKLLLVVKVGNFMSVTTYQPPDSKCQTHFHAPCPPCPPCLPFSGKAQCMTFKEAETHLSYNVPFTPVPTKTAPRLRILLTANPLSKPLGDTPSPCLIRTISLPPSLPVRYPPPFPVLSKIVFPRYASHFLCPHSDPLNLT